MYQTSGSKGQELVAQRMVRQFNKLGQKAYLITGRSHDDREVVPAESFKKGRGYLYVEDSVLKIPVIRVDSYTAKWPPRRIIFRDFIDTLERIVEDFELNVLITHSTLWNGPEDAAKLVTWRRDMRQMGGYQDPLVFCHMSHFQEPTTQRYSLTELTFRTAWNKLSLSKVLETANIVLVVTPFEKAFQTRMGLKPEKCFLFPGGVDEETFLRFAADDFTEFLKKRGIAADRRLVAYLGSIEERKNPMAVLKVAERMKDVPGVHFALAGRGDSPYARDVEKLARDLPNVTYLGEIEEQEKIALIRASYLNIIMSRLEALGIAQLEFMYAGVPVVTSATGGQSWVVQDGVDGLHLKGPEDYDGAVRAITRLLENHNGYRQLAHNAREKASRMTTTEMIAELDDLIDGEMARESGMGHIPGEVQATMLQAEYALKSWAYRDTMVVATNRRIFIRQGRLSRKVTELRYPDIKCIEHYRRWPWGIPLVGAALTAAMFAAPSLATIFSSSFLAQLRAFAEAAAALSPAWLDLSGVPADSLSLLPLVFSVLVFFLRVRSRFSLYGPGFRPVHLASKFSKAIGFIRDYQENGNGVKHPASPAETVDILVPKTNPAHEGARPEGLN
ncbi:MAG: glycosyltransferase [Chloroflexi bacterium]|nr:glycosyltransferase [Chloroflexota bacterium]